MEYGAPYAIELPFCWEIVCARKDNSIKRNAKAEQTIDN